MIYVFGDCQLDTSLYSLERAGQTIRLRPKVFKVCLYLLEHRDRVVSREELCAQVWPGQFISQATLEGVIRTVRQAVGDSGQTQVIIQTLHGYGYRFVAGVEERPSKCIGKEGPPGASAFGEAELVASPGASAQEPEVTPSPLRHDNIRGATIHHDGNGISGTPPVTLAERPTPSQPLQRLRQAALVVQTVAVLILVILGGWALWRGVRTDKSVPLDKSRIAVLPFLTFSAEEDHTYFADGITEELIAQLSQISGLTVIARTSVMQYKGTLKDIPTIGRELQVGSILEGSFRKDGNRVRISAQLIDVASQGHLWSQEYDRELTGVFAIQRDIATRVAQQLKVQMSAGERQRIEEQQGTGNLEAYTLYLQGRYFRNQWTDEGLRKAIAFFEQAIAKDPHYALAHASMADAYLLLPFVAATTRPMDVYPRAMSAVERALQHGAAFATVHTTEASAKLWYAWDWAGAEAAFKKALALSPNDAITHRRYAWYLITRGRMDDAIAVMHRARELSPLSPGIAKNAGLVFYFARQYDQAIAQFRAALDLAPDLLTAYSGLVYAYLQKGWSAKALATCQQMLERWGRTPWILWDCGYTSAVSAKPEQARQILAELHEWTQYTYVKPLAFAWISMALGEKDQALAWLDQAYAEHDPYLTLLNADPIYDPLRNDLRFTSLLQRMGLTK